MNPPNSQSAVTFHINSTFNDNIRRVLEGLPKNEKTGNKPFTKPEAEYLAGIKTLTKSYLFDYSDPDNFYQLVSTVLIMRDGENSLTLEPDQLMGENKPARRKQTFDQIKNFLKSKTWIFPEETVHESPLIDNIRNTIERMILIQEQDPVVAEGNIVCIKPGCESRRIRRREQQTHGADESATVFFLCDICGKSWNTN
uniref:Transcription factor S-II n=1 Tax=Pithovirus LCPAC202 TaxID=2506592 RepID=A0A481Z5K0_9VIRU|nr:MAG: transcription factor S-II [Pithovirus LCPAC202]